MIHTHKNQSTNTPTYPFPQIDHEQAQRQLGYFNYEPGSIKLRLFYHSDDSRKNGDKGRKLNKLNWKEVENYQRDGRGVYVVVNGAGGGHEDKDILQCSAIFCEWDDRPVEDQLLRWETVGFLQPTFTVYSGDKSAQPYWVFNKPITVEQWRELQLLLIEVMDADPSNKNPSRVFRLAGGWHIKPGREPVRSEIVQDSGEKYSYSEIRRELLRLKSLQQPTTSSVQPELTPREFPDKSGQPSLENSLGPIDSRVVQGCPDLSRNVVAPTAQAETASPSTNAVPQYQRYENIQIPVPESVPLEVCLSKDSRSLIDSGVSQGGRNTNGAKLVRDLIGTASHLQIIGQRFDGDPRQLLDEYASRCSPPLPGLEVDAIWRSAEKDRPGPSCTAEGVEACIRGWYWNNEVKQYQAARIRCERNSNGYHAGRGFGNGDSGNGNGNQPPIAAVSLIDRIREILNRYSLESLQVNALMELAGATGRTFNEINQLTKIIRAEGDLADEVIEAVQSFRGILNSCRKRLDIHRYIDSTLAEPILTKAAAQPTAPEYLFNTLLSSSASRIGTSAKIVISPEGSYTQPCIFWTANVAHSGQAKTPPQQVVVKPLEEMEALAKELHDIQLEDYEQDKNADAKPPVRMRRLLNNVTTSTKLRIHDENPRGLLEYLDELVADYQRLNQFKNGKGDDLQLELTFWNGSSANFDRHDARVFLKRTGFSKTGTYQWDTLAQLMADDTNFIASGYSARFLYCSILDAPARYLDLLSKRTLDTLPEKLSWFYQQLESLPQADYLLSHEAKVLFQGWNHTLVNAEIEESHFGLSLVYAKIESYTARIALWLHIVNAVLRDEKPLPVISGQTMQHAIEIASFYLWQHKLIHAHNSPTRKLEGIFLKVQTQAEKFFAKCGKGVGASFLKTRVNALKGWVVEKIRSTVFKTLAAAGHGRIEGEGAEMVYIPSTVPTDLRAPLPPPVGGVGDELVVPPIAESIVNTDVLSPVGEVGVQYPPNLSSSQPVPVPEMDSDPQAKHQFTNDKAETHAFTELTLAGGTTNPSPIPPTALQDPQQTSTPQDVSALILQCQTWVELAQAVGQNTQKLIQAAKRITTEQRQRLTSLLAAHLCQNPSYLEQLTWVPAKLRDRALERLSFTICRLGGDALLDACIERISGCKFLSVEHLGTCRETWVFQTPDGVKLPVFGVDAIEAIAYGTVG